MSTAESGVRRRRSKRPTSPDGRMTLVEHLRELRRRVLISFVAIFVGMIVGFVFHAHILHALQGPYCRLPARYHPIETVEGGCALYVTGITEGFIITLKLSVWSGLILSSPIWLWQIWRFITPGLYRHERRWAITFVAASVGLFLLGAGFAWLALNHGLRFLLGFASSNGLAAILLFNSYLSFVIAMVLVFAISFEFPLIVVMLNLANVLSFQRLKRWTRGIIFGIFAFAGVATPSGDPISMLLLATPMCLLFGVEMLIAYLHDRRSSKRALYTGLDDDEASPLDFDDLDRTGDSTAGVT